MASAWIKWNMISFHGNQTKVTRLARRNTRGLYFCSICDDNTHPQCSINGTLQEVVQDLLQLLTLYLSYRPALSRHTGQRRMYYRFRQEYSWPHMAKYVYHVVESFSKYGKHGRYCILPTATTPQAIFRQKPFSTCRIGHIRTVANIHQT